MHVCRGVLWCRSFGFVVLVLFVSVFFVGVSPHSRHQEPQQTGRHVMIVHGIGLARRLSD